MADTLLALVALILLFFAVSRLRERTRKYSLPYPPGPKPQFLLGNILDLPSCKPWKTFTDWRAIYGKFFVSVRKALAYHSLVRDMARRLFEKRSGVYSSRPYFAMVELLGWAEISTAFMQYGEEWRAHRRLYQKGFRSDASQEYLPLQASKVREFLVNVLHRPGDFMSHTRTLSAAVIMAIVYGHDVAPTNDRFVEIAEKAVGALAESTSPVGIAVNTFPFLRFLPGWLPGCGFQRHARDSRLMTLEMANVPFNSVKEDMASDVGVPKPSLLAKYLEEHSAKSSDALQEEYIKRVAATAYGAGAETTASLLETFFLAMTLHPTVQKKAQQEIESVLGKNRLPTFEDRVNLPYVEVVYRETLRWSPIVPLAIPHCTVADDVVDGYFLPKGTTVIGNVWAITRDPRTYPDPESFIPERFLNEDGTPNDDDMSLIFGFGRRICPGRHVANSTTWLAMVSLLTLFDIQKTKDTEQSLDFDKLFSDGLVQHPFPFPCSITVRSETWRSQLE
uniref:Cytochrome P450 n=1 Tax=Moniliophthora roreri TaxID=221103 RepID=A0A0W0F0L2_MONRR